MSTTVGVLAEPLARRAVTSRYWRGLITKANPRGPQYMRELFAEVVPDGLLVGAGPELASGVRDADRVILLYPDAIGLGWGAVERAVRRTAPAGCAIEVLNGRRRRFLLDGSARRALRLRRVLERGMLGELLMSPLIVGLAVVLWPIDVLRGRR